MSGASLSPSFQDFSVVSEETFGFGVGFLSFMTKCVLEKDEETVCLVTKRLPPLDHYLYEFTRPLHAVELSFYKYFREHVEYDLHKSICPSFESTDANTLLLAFLDDFSMPSYGLGMIESQVHMVLKELTCANATFWTPPNVKSAECPSDFLSSDYNVEMLESLYERLAEPTITLLGEWSAPIIREIGENFEKHLASFYDITKSQGLTHGDLWINNILINDERCVLVDWQFALRRNTLTDVAFFLFSSVSASLLAENQRTWVESYYSYLMERVNQKELYSFEQCWKEYQEAKVYALIILVASFDCFYQGHEGKDYTNGIKDRYAFLVSEIAEYRNSNK